MLNLRAERRLMARISADPRHLIRHEAGRRHGDLRRDAAEYVQKRAPRMILGGWPFSIGYRAVVHLIKKSLGNLPF